MKSDMELMIEEIEKVRNMWKELECSCGEKTLYDLLHNVRYCPVYRTEMNKLDKVKCMVPIEDLMAQHRKYNEELDMWWDVEKIIDKWKEKRA